MNGPSDALERLAHELLFAVDEMQTQRRDLAERIERIGVVVKSIDGLLPSTKAAVMRAVGKTDANHR